MNGGILALGVSHKTAPVALRERLALPEGRAASVLSELVTHADIQEAVAISTCNRTELHLVTRDPVEAESAALSAQREADRLALARYGPPGVLVNSAQEIMQFRGDTSQYLTPPHGRG